MKVTETKKVIQEREVVVGLKCDVCQKDIHGEYWSLITGHYDWGNDSCESIEHFDLCSKDCVYVKLKQYFRDCQDSNTQYFELEQDKFSKKSDSKGEEG